MMINFIENELIMTNDILIYQNPDGNAAELKQVFLVIGK